MRQFIGKMAGLLSDWDQKRLKEVYAPVIVAVPPANAWKHLCVMPDGEIRSYGCTGDEHGREKGERVYLASRDCGLSWKLCPASAKALGEAVRDPVSKGWLSAVYTGPGQWPDGAPEGEGLYAIRNSDGPDGEALIWKKLTDGTICTDVRRPFMLSRYHRWIIPTQYRPADRKDPIRIVLFLSDDGGDTWTRVEPESAPRHQLEWPHQGLRWQNGSCEPTLTELPDGTLYMLARTSRDYHDEYFSGDGGLTWTKPRPSPFHGTLTMPTLLPLSDGRLMIFWCNTQPLPELDHTAQRPPLNDGEISGEGGEDVFTNRDANHAAISGDGGKTWQGFREIMLNPLRNQSDFRTAGGNSKSLDKSIHQFDALELPFGKILLQFGQHELCRKIVLLDPAWLYEKERKEDFRTGLGQVSTQVYVRSVSGNYRGFSGHCAWNRTHGALLVPDPDDNFQEVLQIAGIHDPRLFSDVQGAVWNFPAAHRGHLVLRLRMAGCGLRISLADRWFNPVDPTVDRLAPVSLLLDAQEMSQGVWQDVRLDWDTAADRVDLSISGRLMRQTSLLQPAPNGLSYLHLQSLADAPDEGGALIKRIEMKGED